jgi:hypothetical protein
MRREPCARDRCLDALAAGSSVEHRRGSPITGQLVATPPGTAMRVAQRQSGCTSVVAGDQEAAPFRRDLGEPRGRRFEARLARMRIDQRARQQARCGRRSIAGRSSGSA